MKSILTLCIALVLFSCSSDDGGSTPEGQVVVSGAHHEANGSNDDGFLFKFHANVKNETSKSVTGKVRFNVALGSGSTYVDSNSITLESGASQSVTVISTQGFPSDNPEILSTSFLK